MRSHTFGGQPLDRLDEFRSTTVLDLASPDLRILAICEGSVLVIDGDRPLARTFTAREIERLIDSRSLTLLGNREQVTYASIPVSPEELESLRDGEDQKIVTIRSAGQMLEGPEAAIIAYAQAISSWHRRSRFCGSCGSPARLEYSGHRRVCTSEKCGEVQFPRTDPSVIGIISHGDHCLLVNQPHWAPDRFATIAGFVEPGESLEEAMAREIREEVGLIAEDVRYHSSQPWPFPMSLMIGFEVTVASRDGLRLSDEIRATKWLTRNDLRDQLSRGEIAISTPLSISFALIAEWYGDREELAELASRRPWK